MADKIVDLKTVEIEGKAPQAKPQVISVEDVEITPVEEKETTIDSVTGKVMKHPKIFDVDELSLKLEERKASTFKPPEHIRDLGLITQPSLKVRQQLDKEMFKPKERLKYPFEKGLAVFESQIKGVSQFLGMAMKGFWEGAWKTSIRSPYNIEKPVIDKVEGWIDGYVDYWNNSENFSYWQSKAMKKKAHYAHEAKQKGALVDIANSTTDTINELMWYLASIKGLKAISLLGGSSAAVGGMATTTGGAGQSYVAMMKHLRFIGAHGLATTQGDIKDRLVSAGVRMGYNMTPYVVNATGLTGFAAVGGDTLANTMLTLPTYVKAFQEAGGFTTEFAALAIPQFTVDFGMAWKTRGLPKNVRDKQIRDYILKRPDPFKLDPKEGLQYINDLRTRMQKAEKPSIKGQVEKTFREETRERRKAVEPIEKEVEKKVTKEPVPEPQRREITERIEKIKETQIYKKDGTFRANYKEGLRKVEKLQQNLEEFTQQKKLRQRIDAYKAVKGMTDAELKRVTKKKTGHTKLTHKDLMVKDLEKVLDSVKRTRPKYIKHKRVITHKTEKKVRQTKKRMIKEGEMTEKDFEDILDVYNVDYLGYRSKTTFMTEKQGKDVLRDMIYLSPIIKERTRLQQNLEKNPALKASYNKIDNHFKNKFKDRLARVNGLLDMHHFADSMEKQTGLPFGFMWERFNEARLQTEREVDERLNQLPELVGKKEFKSISTNEQSLDRIEDYIASKLPEYVRRKPIEPKDITKEEKKIADFIIKDFKNFEWMVRYERFYEWYEKGTRIPNAPQKELNKGADILEGKGDQALQDWLKTRSWGVIKKGYTPAQVLSHKVRAYKTKIGLGKKGLRARETKRYKKPEKDILKRYYSYVRSMLARTNLKPEVNAWTTLFNNNTDAFFDKGKMQIYIQRNLKEMLGQREPAAGYDKLFQGVYGQAMKAIFLDPRKGIRNLFQNLAFYTSLEDALKMRPLSAKDKEYFDTQVSQSSGIKKDWLYADINWIKTLQNSDSVINKVVGKGLTPLDKLNMMADAVNVMGRTDDINRSIAFRMKLGSVRRAMKAFPDYKKDINTFNKMMRKAGIGDLTLMETKHAIRQLATGGKDAFARYAAKATAQKVHFLYERAQREPIAQGSELSRIATNLLTFRKGYLQRLTLDFQKFRDKELTKTFGMRKKATRSIIGATVGATFIGVLYQLLTGKERNPYRVDYITQGLSLGGLATGAQEQIGEFGYIAHKAALGDEWAQHKLPYLISRTSDMFIPFFDDYINLMETLQDTQSYDQQIIDKARELIQKRYRARPKAYWRKQRDLIEKGQHALFGTEKK